MTGLCPRCNTSVTSAPDERGLFVCSHCGAQLRAPAASALATATSSEAATPRSTSDWDAVQSELRALRKGQDQILAKVGLILSYLRDAGSLPSALQASGGYETEPAGWPVEAISSAPLKTRRRQKTVLVVDDDPDTLEAATEALGRAQVPVRGMRDGKSALAGIAADKPDLIVLELDLAGPTSGRDLVNMVKATMAWVDIPIVLYTRLDITPEQAREIHGGDEYVPKGAASAEALVTCVEALLRAA